MHLHLETSWSRTHTHLKRKFHERPITLCLMYSCFFSFLFYLVLFHLDRKKPSLELLNQFAYPEWVITHSLRKTAPLCSQELLLLGCPCCPQVRTLTANPDSLQQSCSRPFIIIIILQLYVACHSLSASQWFDRKREVCICAFSALVVTLEQLLPDSNQLNLSSAELGVS